MNPLVAAQRGYLYQDFATAYFFARALAQAKGSLIVNRQDFDLDRFDDLVYRDATLFVRRQFKHSESATRELTTNDFVKSPRLRVDGLVRCHIQARQSPPNQYRLCATWVRSQDAQLLNVLEPVACTPSFNGDASVCFRIKSDSVWPSGGDSIWQPLNDAADITRQDFVEFANRFIIELECATTSRDFNHPGPLERLILGVLQEQVGIGRFPNDALDASRVGTELVLLAYKARTENNTVVPEDIEHELRLRKDFGRVAQQFPIDRNVYVSQAELAKQLADLTETHRLVTLTGPPGSGKSWTLDDLVDELSARGHLVAKHYCYLEPGDHEVQRRITSNVLFANLMAELIDAVPQIRDEGFPRYAAGPQELETILPAAVRASTTGTVILLIDGVDHISRVAAEAQSLARSETDIIEELAALKLPPGVRIVISSQPGKHLEELEDPFSQNAIARITMPDWQSEHIALLMDRWGIGQALRRHGFEELDPDLVNTIWQRSEGNPLYAMYLCRMLLASLEEAQATLPVNVVTGAPPYSGDMTHYYGYLLNALNGTAGLVADLLGVIDFGITESELRAVFPIVAHHVPEALRRLAPVLMQLSGQGGLRVYHESFRRFIIERLKEQGGSVGDALAPIINWLRSRGFYEDAKTYRFLIPCLRRSARDDEILALIGPTFISNSVAAGHFRAAVEANISVAVDIAAERMDWPLLSRCTQLLSAAYTCFEEKFDTDLFGQTFCELHGANTLADRLLFDGRPTMPRRRGLRLCALCDEAAGTAPWKEYLDLHPYSSDDRNDNATDQGVLDTIRGNIRLDGIDDTYRRLGDWLSRNGEPDDGFTRTALRIVSENGGPLILDRMCGEFALSEKAAILVAIELAWARQKAGDAIGAQTIASDLVRQHLPASLAYECLQLGCNPGPLQVYITDLNHASVDITGGQACPKSEKMMEWIAAVSITSRIAPDALALVANSIVGEGWYRDWLRYVIALTLAEVRALTDPMGAEADLLRALHELAVDTYPFKGTPRACDLYSIWHNVHTTVARGLRLLTLPDSWTEALSILVQISEGTTTSLGRSSSGPITAGALMKLLMPHCSDSALNGIIAGVIRDQLQRSERSGEYYEIHAEHEMRLAWCLMRGGNHAEALGRWNKAAMYLAGYGFRKDISLFEFVESAPQLAQTNRELASDALARVQPLTQIAVDHTDGRETKHLHNSWFNSLCEADLAGSLVLLARTLSIGGGRHLWKLETAVEDALKVCRGRTDPLPLNFLQMTLRADEDTRDGEGKAATIDALLQQNLHLGEQVLRVLAAQVSCDESGTTDNPYALLQEVAARHAIILPPLTPSTGPAVPTGDPTIPRATSSDNAVALLPLFPAETTPLEIMATLRKAPKQYYDRADDHTSILNALGYRLIGLIDSGAEQEAVRIIRYLSRQYHFSSAAILLADIASGLERHGHLRVASITWALAYIHSRGGGGWLLLGGEQYAHWFHHAVELSPRDAWSTLAVEIADLLHRGRTLGITRHLVGLCATELSEETAYAVWDAGFEVMTHRLPEPHDSHQLFLPYSPMTGAEWSVTEALVYVLVSRLNHPEFQRKLTALTGLVTLVSQTPELTIRPLRSALSVDTPLSSCTLILQSLWEAETSPFVITRALALELQILRQCNNFSVAAIATDLLERGGIRMQQNGKQAEIGKLGALRAEREEDILSLDWGDRIQHIAELWPAFPRLVAARFEEIWRSGGMHERSRSRYDIARSNSGRKIPPTDLLHWEQETFECAFQEILKGIKAEIWRAGLWEPSIEQQILMNVVPDVLLHVKAWYSRSVRPPMPLPSKLHDQASPVSPVDIGDEYDGWYRCGYYEQQYLMSQDSNRSVVGVRRAVKGIICLRDGENPRVGLPVGYADMSIAWQPTASPDLTTLRYVFGPLAAFDFVASGLGEIPMLALSPVLVRRFGLHLEPRLGRLELLDAEQRTSAIFRRWSAGPLGKQIDEETPQLSGCDLLIRSDLYARLITITPNNPIEVTKIVSMPWPP